jgi:hypothetical protein
MKPLRRAEQERMADLYELALTGDTVALEQARELAARTRLQPFERPPRETAAQERRRKLLARLPTGPPLTTSEVVAGSGLYGADGYSMVAHVDLDVLAQQGHVTRSDDGPVSKGKPAVRWVRS